MRNGNQAPPLPATQSTDDEPAGNGAERSQTVSMGAELRPQLPAIATSSAASCGRQRRLWWQGTAARPLAQEKLLTDPGHAAAGLLAQLAATAGVRRSFGHHGVAVCARAEGDAARQRGGDGERRGDAARCVPYFGCGLFCPTICGTQAPRVGLRSALHHKKTWLPLAFTSALP